MKPRRRKKIRRALRSVRRTGGLGAKSHRLAVTKMNNELLHLCCLLLAFSHMGRPFWTLTDFPYPGIGFLDYTLAFWRQSQTVSELQASRSNRIAECAVWSVAPEGTERSTGRDRVSAKPGVAPWVWLSYLPSPGTGASLLSGKLFC